MSDRGWYGGLEDRMRTDPLLPVQVSDNYRRWERLPEPLLRLAYEEYGRHFKQPFEVLHERGGFSIIEILLLLADNAEYWKRRAGGDTS